MKYAGRLGHRVARVTFAVVFMSMAGCGGDDDPPTITGEYTLDEVDGAGPPRTIDVGSVGTINSGTFDVETDGWTMALVLDPDDSDGDASWNDEGTYTDSEGNLDFNSTSFDDTFTGTVDGEVLEIEYDFDGDGELETQLTFNRD